MCEAVSKAYNFFLGKIVLCCDASCRKILIKTEIFSFFCSHVIV
jgi:hypothetical protein